MTHSFHGRIPSRAASIFRASAGLALLAALSATPLVACVPELDGGDDFTQAYDSWLHKCSACHTPAASSAVPGTESSLDFSSADKARASLRGGAKGLTGNFAGCNDVAFVVPGKPEQSLLMAAIDSDARATFDVAGKPGCSSDAISDMAIKVGGPDTVAIAKVRAWIAAGAL